MESSSVLLPNTHDTPSKYQWTVVYKTIQSWLGGRGQNFPKWPCLKHLLIMSKDKCAFEVTAGSCHWNIYGRTKEIKPVNQTRKAKLNWKHTHARTLETLKSLDKRTCMWGGELQVWAKSHFQCLQNILHKPFLHKITKISQLLVYFCISSCGQKAS